MFVLGRTRCCVSPNYPPRLSLSLSPSCVPCAASSRGKIPSGAGLSTPAVSSPHAGGAGLAPRTGPRLRADWVKTPPGEQMFFTLSHTLHPEFSISMPWMPLLAPSILHSHTSSPLFSLESESFPPPSQHKLTAACIWTRTQPGPLFRIH